MRCLIWVCTVCQCSVKENDLRLVWVINSFMTTVVFYHMGKKCQSCFLGLTLLSEDDESILKCVRRLLLCTVVPAKSDSDVRFYLQLIS